MSGLYKRYIPPKPAGSAAVPSLPNEFAAPIPPKPPKQDVVKQPPPVQKRKRERSEDEIAERKAKKLRNKGLEATKESVLKAQAEAKVEAEEQDVAQVEAEEETTAHAQAKQQAEKQDVRAVEAANAAAEALGDFSHVKSNKKRHKMEKEFRKVKKAGKVEDNAVEGTDQPEENTEGAEDRTEEATMPDETPTAEALPAAVPPVSQPKKRRHKLESVLQSKVDDSVAEENDDDSHLRKHSNIIGKFQKSASRAEPIETSGDQEDPSTAKEPPVARDLVPTPQLDPAATPDFVPNDAHLPEWLRKPDIITSQAMPVTFSSLIPSQTSSTLKNLTNLGFASSTPVQAALIPLLLPAGAPGARHLLGTESVVPDLAVSAATGSGKTIAYLVPMIEGLVRTRERDGEGRLRGLIVVPTQELVEQVRDVAEKLARGTELCVGTATGTTKLKDEQAALIEKMQIHDAARAAELEKKASGQNYPPEEDDSDFEDYLDDLDNEDPREAQRLHDFAFCDEDHVPVYRSTCDLLICTPGRLLEHIGSTLGFTLAHLEWLILDEADKLLDQQYDGFLESVNHELERERTIDEQPERERYLKERGLWSHHFETRVRKVVLSATMTRDVAKLTGLRLVRPKLIVVQGQGQQGEETQALPGAETQQHVLAGNGTVVRSDALFEIPEGLKEYCVPLPEDGETEKPLFLIQLLDEKVLEGVPVGKMGRAVVEKKGDSEDSDSSESESDLSDSSSDVSSSSSDSSVSSRDSIAGDDEPLNDPDTSTVHPTRAALLATKPSWRENGTRQPTVLIFTSSNESTTRLAHLLRKLKPEWSPYISALTKDKVKKKRSNRPSDLSKPVLAIATDRAARGLDMLQGRNITHVIQYDVPRALEGYVHRVGRTARAGRAGEGWTLYTWKEAKWFLSEIVYSQKVRRRQPVEKVKILLDESSDIEGLRERYRDVLDGMREEVARA